MVRKNKYKLLSVAFALMMLSSCIVDSQIISQPYGIIQVSVADDAARSTRADGSWINTIRFIVFTDLATNPKVEINRVYTAEELEVSAEEGETPSMANIVLKVARRASGSNDKLVVAIVNEPDDVLLKDLLSGVATPADLGALKLKMSHFVAEDHHSLKPDAMMPMTGALWTNQIYRTEEEAAQEGKRVQIKVQRVVARVDVYLKKGEDVEPDLKMSTGTTIKLDNTYDESFFIRHTQGANVLGNIQTVASEDLFEKSWSLDSGEQAISDTEPVCVFYTTERNHTADRLTLAVSVKTPEGATRSGSLEITKAMDKNKVEYPVDIIRRNNIYQVFVTIGANGITAEVRDWNDQNINTEF